MSLLIDGQDNPDAAWYYPDPKPAARKIKGYVAFWRGVEVAAASHHRCQSGSNARELEPCTIESHGQPIWCLSWWATWESCWLSPR
jgi:hypothetical protein